MYFSCSFICFVSPAQNDLINISNCVIKDRTSQNSISNHNWSANVQTVTASIGRIRELYENVCGHMFTSI